MIAKNLHHEQDGQATLGKKNGNIRIVPAFHTEVEWEEEWVVECWEEC